MTQTELPWRVSTNLATWYLVARSAEVPEGGVKSARVGDREVVLFRSEGEIHALDPHCAHMGAKLCQGSVRDGHLTCPLHGWQYRGDGCVSGMKTSARSWPVAERMCAILVFNGLEATFDPPVE